MVLYGQLVIGAPGAGKSTYCAGLVDMLTQMGRPLIVMNLDPANDVVPFKCHIDIKELITVEDAMKYHNLGPNGALRYCMKTLITNVDWLMYKVKKLDKEGYLIIDMPGQLELYNSDDSITRLIEQFGKWNWRVCAVHLSDAVFISDAGKFVSLILAALSIMINLEVPQVNVLTKADLIDPKKLPYDFSFFQELPDTKYLANLLDDHPFMLKYKDLTSKLCDVIDDYGLVGFHPLSVKSQELMRKLLKLADTANGLEFTDSEDIRAVVT
uniref:GPN-loop GTPase 2 n=1 Tax=Panagrolaimus sp. JU765 TaxID=591449 RepID=A0AC34R602_9BILA